MLDPRVESVVQDLGVVYASEATPDEVKAWCAHLANKLLDTANPFPGLSKGDPLPQTLGHIADEYAIVRAARLEAGKATDRIKERETELYNAAMAWLAESTDTGASGDVYRVQKVKKVVQNVTDWPAFYEFVKQTGSFEMLQRRLADKAVKEYKDDKGELPAGVSESEIDTLSFTKV